MLVDKGFVGADFQQHLAELGALLARPDRKDEPYRFGRLAACGSGSSAFDTLKGQLGLERHGSRMLGGVFVRVAQRLLALAACVWWNWETGAVSTAEGWFWPTFRDQTGAATGPRRRCQRTITSLCR